MSAHRLDSPGSTRTVSEDEMCLQRVSAAEDLEAPHGERGESRMHRVRYISCMRTTKRHLSICTKFPR